MAQDAKSKCSVRYGTSIRRSAWKSDWRWFVPIALLVWGRKKKRKGLQSLHQAPEWNEHPERTPQPGSALWELGSLELVPWTSLAQILKYACNSAACKFARKLIIFSFAPPCVPPKVKIYYSITNITYVTMRGQYVWFYEYLVLLIFRKTLFISIIKSLLKIFHYKYPWNIEIVPSQNRRNALI